MSQSSSWQRFCSWWRSRRLSLARSRKLRLRYQELRREHENLKSQHAELERELLVSKGENEVLELQVEHLGTWVEKWTEQHRADLARSAVMSQLAQRDDE